MGIELKLTNITMEAIKQLYGHDIAEGLITFQKTRKEFEGDMTLVVFPFLKLSKKSPEQTVREIGEYILSRSPEVEKYNVVKGFLNISVSPSYWKSYLFDIYNEKNFGIQPDREGSPTVVVEYSSPNTNKPLHLGHIRNNLLGFSLSKILKANGNRVVKVNIVNDRGIHICKSMLAWQKWGKGETPESSGIKGDHFVGDFYVKFEQAYKKEVEGLKNKGVSEDEAKKEAPLIKEAREMLRKWETNDAEVRKLWTMMNQWVYKGFDETYQRLGVDFDKIYYESETYMKGKQFVLDALKKDILVRKEDGSVWADLTTDGLDEKILLRSDGTSVYMTQDIGTAHQRYEDYHFDKQVYVVGNEQNYHFQVLSMVLQKMGFPWAKDLYHLSYGMVELPEGKMKSREGTVVDADDLIDEMIYTAREISAELGKLDGYTEEEKKDIYYKIGLGALKYYILKVDPKRTMTFNPRESVDFNGNTGPFIQYTYARIQSLKRKAGDPLSLLHGALPGTYGPLPKEVEIIKFLSRFPEMIKASAEEYNPGLLANYLFDLVKEYNQYYHDITILGAEDENAKKFRLLLSDMTGRVIGSGMELLGIETPERM